MRRNKGKNVFINIGRLTLVIVAICTICYASNELKHILYPLKYSELVQQYADEYNLDPFLVYAVIKVESSFNEKAVSPKDARGLMQIMPNTAAWIAQKLKDDRFDAEDLFEPDKNIMMGTWYIKYLTEKFDGDITLAIMAYNAGPGSVQNWLLDESISNDGKTIDTIPYGETANYRRKIMNSYEMYKKIYGNV